MNRIYEGSHGSGKREAALKVASSILGTCVEESPDFLLVEPDEKGFISVDRMKEISEFCRYGGTRVVVITNLHVSLERFQQSLLKLLEDTDATFILTAERPLLDTIYSRCQRVYKRADSIKEAPENKTAWLLSGGSKGLYEALKGEAKYIKAVEGILAALKARDAAQFFRGLGIIPDTADTFYSKFGVEKTECFLTALSAWLIGEKQYQAMGELVTSRDELMLHYSRNSWFVFWKNIWTNLD